MVSDAVRQKSFTIFDERIIMDKNEIFAFINANQICFLATVEGKKPRVRGMMPYRADEKGIIFHTGKMKDLTKQLQANPEVELCFFNAESNTQVRVSGKAEFVDDLNLKKEIVEKRPFMKPWIEQFGYEPLAFSA